MFALIISLSLIWSAVGYAAESPDTEEKQPTITIEAPSRVTKGERVQVSVIGRDLAELYGYQLQLQYDPAFMAYGNATYDFSPQGYAVPVTDNNGELTLAFTKIGDQTAGVSGTKKLLTATFTARKSGSTSFVLPAITLVNSEVQSTALTPQASAAVRIVEPSQGSSSPSTPSVPTSGEEEGGNDVVYGVNPSTVKNENGKSMIELPASATQIKLSPEVLAAIGGNNVVLQSEELTIELPSSVLNALIAQLPNGVTGTIAFTMKRVDAVKSGSSSESGSSHSTVVSRGQAYDFSLSIQGSDGSKQSMTTFQEPITMRFAADAAADQGLTGIYYVRSDGALEYIGGEWSGNTLTADIHHFSTYAVLEMKTDYSDVPANHWASRVIAELSAKQVVKGIGAGEFRPSQLVTRAEFAALLVRGLKLEAATGTQPFTDVQSGAWHASDVNTAYASGIVKGRSGNRFDPNATITRQEMAVMLINAVQAKKEEQTTSDAKLPFQDLNEAAAWALPSIAKSYELGLVKGRAADRFVPQGELMRAEAAQAVYLLMNL
nr:S-layer homology domain-containing protein [Paenibacillus phyllosphaerae]